MFYLDVVAQLPPLPVEALQASQKLPPRDEQRGPTEQLSRHLEQKSPHSSHRAHVHHATYKLSLK